MDNRRALLAGNWKMYKNGSEAEETAKKLVSLVANVTDRDIMIAPPYTALFQVSNVLKGSNVGLGAQNLHWENQGAYTGEISTEMLISAGCNYVIIGHSERRQYFGETDETVNKKLHKAIAAGLIPVVCVGETEKERDANLTFSVLDKQVKNGLKGVSLEKIGKVVIAYEPVWAIGTGKTASKEQAQEAHKFIREKMESIFGQIANLIRILYGGSVKPGNISELMAMSDVDGALVGGASLDAESFAKIVTYK
jgi:triosephosphate isomerase